MQNDNLVADNYQKGTVPRSNEATTISSFTINAEILARSLANFHCQYADKHMNL